MFDTIFCKQMIIHILRCKRILAREKRKMLKQQVYNAALDFPLFIEKQRCKNMCYKFNRLAPEKIIERNNIISKIFGKVGKVFYLEQPFMCDYGYNIEIGENFCSNHNLLILDPAKVTFGDNVMVGPNCSFYTTSHPHNPTLRNEGLQWANPITVGHNVWICGNVTVLGGVTIGDNSIIGAGSVVTKDIPANSIAVGNPCRIVKKIEY